MAGSVNRVILVVWDYIRLYETKFCNRSDTCMNATGCNRVFGKKDIAALAGMERRRLTFIDGATDGCFAPIDDAPHVAPDPQFEVSLI